MRSVLAVTLAAVLGFVPCTARAQSLALVRDTEIETDIRVMASPVWEAAGLDPKSVNILLVNDPTLNAFVAAGQNLFLHTGLIIRTENPGQLIGVMAHETGHMSGGHLARTPDAYENAMITSLLATIAGVAAGVAAAAANGHDRACRYVGNSTCSDDPSSGIIAGTLAGQSMAERQFFAFSRGIEASADQAGMTFLDETHQSSKGFLQFMQILETQEFISTGKQDPYLRTHPLSSERVDLLRKHVDESKWSDVPYPPEYFAMHRRMRAKLIGFMYPLDKVLQSYPETDTSLEGRYARAIAYYRLPDLKRALPLIDALIKENPTDQYFYELKGQMLFENGRVAEAIPPYQQAVKLMPTGDLLKIDFAKVQIESNDPKLLQPAVALLTDAQKHEHDVPDLWRLMGVAYGRQGDIGMASSALAQEALLEGRRDDARDQARRAMRMLPPGSPGWLRAQDVENAAIRGKKDRNE